jgi:hypothetical protein
MGGDCHWLGITQEVRKAVSKNLGDKVSVVIILHSPERIRQVDYGSKKGGNQEKQTAKNY